MPTRVPEHIMEFRNQFERLVRMIRKNKEISEDDLKGFEKKVQDLTDKYVAEVHDVQKKKDVELMEI